MNNLLLEFAHFPINSVCIGSGIGTLIHDYDDDDDVVNNPKDRIGI